MDDITIMLCINLMSQVYTDEGPNNPLVGSYSVEERLDVFSSAALVKMFHAIHKSF